jgi:hypothetical protein
MTGLANHRQLVHLAGFLTSPATTSHGDVRLTCAKSRLWLTNNEYVSHMHEVVRSFALFVARDALLVARDEALVSHNGQTDTNKLRSHCL